MQQWNAMFSIGGPACLITTIEGNTGLRMDHFAVIDFNGFRDMVDALGGVPICAPEAIDDPKAKLKLAAGRHVLDGAEALGYVRARKTLGDGSDLGRIERQQAFLSSVVQEATRTSLLLRPDKLFGFLNAATQLAHHRRGLRPRHDEGPRFERGRHRDVERAVHHRARAGVPRDPNRVEWAPSAEVLWQTLRGRRRRGGEAVGRPVHLDRAAHRQPDGGRGGGRQRHGCPGARCGGRGGAGGAGLPRRDHRELAGTRPNGVVVEYGAGGEEAARTVAAAFEGATLREDASVTSGVRVVLGAGAPAVQEIPNRTGSSPVPTPSVSAPEPSPTPTITTRKADQDICS